MSDITERLRQRVSMSWTQPGLCQEAADEIDRLRADLREERERIASMRIEWAAEVAALDAKIDALRTDGVRVLIAASQPAWDA